MPARSYDEIAADRGLPSSVAKRGRADDLSVRIEFLKATAKPDERLVYGWVSVVTKAGKPVVDDQGDIVTPATLEKAAHDYLRKSRVGKRQHRGKAVMELVESVVFTKAKQKALGIDLGREGWFAGWHVHDDAVWAEIKAGKLPGFSIGGTGVRIPLKD